MTIDNDEALELTAYHEAGHAVAMWKHELVIDQVSIEPDEDEDANHSGMVEGKSPLSAYSLDAIINDEFSAIEKQKRVAVLVLLAGMAAEQIYDLDLFKSVARLYSGHYEYDLRSVQIIARTLGYTDEKEKEWIQDRLDETKAMLKKEWDRVSALADTLLAKKTLPGVIAVNVIEKRSL